MIGRSLCTPPMDLPLAETGSIGRGGAAATSTGKVAAGGPDYVNFGH